MDLLAQYASSSDSDVEDGAAAGHAPPNGSDIVAPPEKKAKQGKSLQTMDSARPRKRLKSTMSKSVVEPNLREGVKETPPEPLKTKKGHTASSILQFAPPQLSRNAPNASTEDLDKWNSAGVSKHRRLAIARGQNK